MSVIAVGGNERIRPIAKLELDRKRVIEPAGRSYLQTLKRIFVLTSAVSAILIVVAAIAAGLFYNHYASIVERRVNAGFWQTRAGMYAAPYQIRKNQAATPEAVVELLRRSGYMEGGADGNVWNGSFQQTPNSLTITSSDAYSLEPQTTDIKFTAGRIDHIKHNGVLTDSYQIEAEMLSGRSETKRAKNHVLKFDEIPQNLRHAILAAEDQRFFEHYGLDPRGIVRAAVANFNGGQIKQGGSTITQQLVKNTFLTPERSFSRKFSEAFLSLALENKMSKEDIFAVYCNEIYLGQYGASGVHGVEQAARAYFDKDLKDINLAEAATIAAMIKNPRAFSPVKNAENSASRRNWILARMQELNLANGAELELARATDIKLAPPKRNDNTIAPYFVDAATRELTDKITGDYLNSNFNARVYTTIDTQIQAVAERAVTKHLEGLDKVYGKGSPSQNRLQATIVALDPHTGHVVAMVGGRDYRESQFNRATDAMRAPGSTFKPVVYATAYERGFSPISTAADRPSEFATLSSKLYTPANYHNSYAMTNITLKTALVKSSNVVAVKTAMDVGLHDVARKAKEFGLGKMDAYPSMALGTMEVTPLQLAAAYAVFANGGKAIEPTFVDTVVSGSDQTVHLSSQTGKQVIREQTAYMVTDALIDVTKRGTAAKANGALGKNVVFAGKTGTSKDGWFVGYTPNLVTVAWVGFDDNEDLNATGGDIALPLWVEFMREVVQMRPEYGGSQFNTPKGLAQVIVDPETGMAAGPHCPHKETAIVTTSAATYVRCFKHEPVNTMYALADGWEVDENATTIEPVAEVQGVQIERELKPAVNYEEVSDNDDSLNIRRPSSGSNEEPAKQSRTPQSQIEESDRVQLEKLKKQDP